MNNREKFLNNVVEKYRDQYDCSDVKYINSRTPITIICKDHGSFIQRPNLFLHGRICPECASKEKGTDIASRQQKFIERCKERYEDKFVYDKVIYVDMNTPCTFTCKEHGDFILTPTQILNGRNCPDCKKENKSTYKKHHVTVKQRLEESREIHNNKYDYSLVPLDGKISDVVSIICPTHNVFLQSLSVHKRSGCPDCAKIAMKEKKLKYTKEEYFKLITNYTVVDFVSISKDASFICDEHGLFVRNARTILNGGSCPDCFSENQRQRASSSTEEFIEESKKLYGNKYRYDKVVYKDYKSEITLYCNEHKRYFDVKVCDHMDVSRDNCPGCIHDKRVRIHKENQENSYENRLNEYIELLKIKQKHISVVKDTFYNRTSSCDFICEKHGNITGTANIVLNSGCPNCVQEKAMERIKNRHINKAKKKFGDKYDYSKVVYVNANSEVEIRCKEHDVIFTQKLFAHSSSKYPCPECLREALSGENNANYINGNTTESDKVRRTSEYRNWRKKIVRIFPACDCCNIDFNKKEKLFAHHLYSFEHNEELRYDVSNGVGLCRKCHEDFHNKYGYGHNTSEQYEEYKKIYH